MQIIDSCGSGTLEMKVTPASLSGELRLALETAQTKWTARVAIRYINA